jgi:ribosomal protein S18 acetylase RimI-like enzyme
MAGDRLAISAVAANEPPLSGNDALKSALGGMLAAAVPHFYGLLPLEGSVLHRALGEAIGTTGSEFANAFMAGDSDKPAGIVTALPAQDLARAQQASTLMLMRHVDRADMAAFRSAIGGYSETVEPIEGSGQYLSRVAVAPAARGQGVGRALVERIIALAEGGDVWLHVASDNGAAIRLYESLGFEFASAAPYNSRAMRRSGKA